MTKIQLLRIQTNENAVSNQHIQAGTMCPICDDVPLNSMPIIVEHNQAPVAVAGIDRIIWLPMESVTLDGSNSTDDQKIDSYQWIMLR